MTEAVKRAAEEIPSLPSTKREALWVLLWQGTAISFLVFFLEYTIWAPLWNHAILPAWEYLT